MLLSFPSFHPTLRLLQQPQQQQRFSSSLAADPPPPSPLSSRVPLLLCVCKQVMRSYDDETKEAALILSRRGMLLTVLSTATVHFQGIEAWAGDSTTKSCIDLNVTRKVFFDVSIDGEPAGRFVVGVYGEDAPIGANRFADIAVGQRGISFRKKEFYKITSSYIQNAGLRTFSLSGGAADAASFPGGATTEALIPELKQLAEKCLGTKNLKGTVSILVNDPNKPPLKTKLITKDGKFEVVQEESKADPNGTEFMIALADAPQLDNSNLVVGRVLEGMEVILKIAGVKVVQENTSSPYFRAAKLVGDTRAVVAERGFNRPYSKIVITKCGELKE